MQEPDITLYTYSQMKDLIEPAEGSHTIPNHLVEVEFSTIMHGSEEDHSGILIDFMGSRPGQRESDESDITLTVRCSDGKHATIYQKPDSREGNDDDYPWRVIWNGEWGGTNHAIRGKVAVFDLQIRIDFDQPPICPVCDGEMFPAMTDWKPQGLGYDYDGLICKKCFPNVRYTEGFH